MMTTSMLDAKVLLTMAAMMATLPTRSGARKCTASTLAVHTGAPRHLHTIRQPNACFIFEGKSRARSSSGSQIDFVSVRIVHDPPFQKYYNGLHSLPDAEAIKTSGYRPPSYSIVDSTSNAAEPESYSINLDGATRIVVSQRGASVPMMGQWL